MTFPPEIQRMMMEMEIAGIEDRIARVKADPVKHKKTLQWDGELRWRYYDGGVDRRGVRHRFCWTTTRNAAGYFLAFDEVWNGKKGVGERKRFVASKRRATVKDKARSRWETWKKR